jgi:pimeloyl-ACP methyl ester carboxylesterase
MTSRASSGWRLAQRWESGDGTVRFDTLGSGPPLVLVHGTPSSSYLWRHVAADLSRDWTIYLYDLLGYGASEQRDGQDVSIGAQTRVLCELLDHWGLDSPAIAAHDFGGAITLRAHLLEGRDFSKLALLDPVVLGPWGSPFFTLVRDNVGVFQQLPAAIHAAVVAAYLRGAFHSRLDEAELAPYVDPWLGAAGQDAFYRQIAQADQRFTDEIEPLLGEIRAPVSVLWGAEDRWIPVATGARLAGLVAGGRLTTIEAAGHFLQEDAPQPVGAALRAFFQAEDAR